MSDLAELTRHAREQGWPVETEPAADVFGWRRVRASRDGCALVLVFNADDRLDAGYLLRPGDVCDWHTTQRRQVRNWLDGVVGQVVGEVN